MVYAAGFWLLNSGSFALRLGPSATYSMLCALCVLYDGPQTTDSDLWQKEIGHTGQFAPEGEILNSWSGSCAPVPHLSRQICLYPRIF
jgi:hypothetical protein